MSLKNKMVLLILLLNSFVGYSQTDNINYQHKMLVKVLKKAGLTNMNQTYEIKLPDSISNSYIIEGKYFKIESEKLIIYKYIYVGRVNSCRIGGCSISNKTNNDGNSEYFDYYILFNESKTVSLVKIFNYNATHGQEVTSRSWLRQFVGYDNSEELQINKNIDSISGATISVYAITQDIEEKTKILNIFRDKLD